MHGTLAPLAQEGSGAAALDVTASPGAPPGESGPVVTNSSPWVPSVRGLLPTATAAPRFLPRDVPMQRLLGVVICEMVVGFGWVEETLTLSASCLSRSGRHFARILPASDNLGSHVPTLVPMFPPYVQILPVANGHSIHGGEEEEDGSFSSSKVQGPNKFKGSFKNPWYLYYDGASVMSKSYAGSGAVLKDHGHHTLEEFATYIGPQTMNVAEYIGLLGGLRLALKWKVTHLCCCGDSRVVHNQVKGSWKTRRFKMAFLCFHVCELLKLFKSVKFKYIRRIRNMHAARLAHEAINIHWDKMEFYKLKGEEENQKSKGNSNDDKDENDVDDEYYEYRKRLKKDK